MTSDRSRLHFYFPNKCGGRAWPRRRHLHKSWSAEQCGLLAANRNTIYHCRRIKIHTRPLHEGWETMSSPLIKARWILQFMASLLLLASVRHRGQKGRVPTVCVWCEYNRASFPKEWWKAAAQHIDQRRPGDDWTKCRQQQPHSESRLEPPGSKTFLSARGRSHLSWVVTSSSLFSSILAAQTN